MKKIPLITVIFFTLLQIPIYSQDIIYKTDGSKEEARVTLVGEEEIQYKKFTNLDGPVYVLNKKEIVLITYENGDYDLINSHFSPESLVKVELTENYAKNILNYHFFDVFYGDITISYERIIADGIVGIHIPVGFGYAYNFEYFNDNSEWVKNLIFSGVGINFYPGGQGKWRYFVGPKILVGYGKQSYWQTYWDDQGNYLYDDEEFTEGVYTKYMVDNGVRFTPVKNFSVSAVLSVGVRYFPQTDYYNNVVMPTGHFGMNVSYRF
jgi:hypothetical protein